MLGLGIALGVAALGVGIGQGIAANGALSGIARQPEAAGKIQTAMLIALAFMELVFLLTFVSALILQAKVTPGA
jgi:F-type H+-transporting ATPase subunit c